MTESKYRTIRGLIAGLSFALFILYKDIFNDLSNFKFIILEVIFSYFMYGGFVYLYDRIIKKLYPEFIRELELPYKDERAMYLNGLASYKTLNILAWFAMLSVFYFGATKNMTLALWMCAILVSVFIIHFAIYKYYEYKEEK